MYDENVKKFSTSCNNCIFAEHNVTFPASKQTGCQLGRLEKFKEQDRVELQPQGYYIIEGICNTCRGETWQSAQLGNAIAAVERETHVSLDFVVYDADGSAAGVVRRVESLVNSCVKQKQMGMVKCTSQYICTCSLNEDLPSNLISVLNTKINHDLKRISLVEPTYGYHRMIVQNALYRAVNKNRAMPVFQKIRELAEDQDNLDQILTWEQLWSRE
jgi:hypothetical protein